MSANIERVLQEIKGLTPDERLLGRGKAAKDKLGGEEFSQLLGNVPGLSDLMKKAPSAGGGTIAAANHPGGGASVCFTLPGAAGVAPAGPVACVPLSRVRCGGSCRPRPRAPRDPPR